MGNRNYVMFEGNESINNLSFYTHWDGSSLHKTVQSALKRSKERWNDPTYLARIIFCEMIKDDLMGLTGAGIATTEYFQCESPPVYIDVARQRVLWNESYWSFERFIDIDFGEK